MAAERSAEAYSGDHRRARPELAHGVMDMFAGDDIDVMHADWSSLAEHAPFSLIFMDATSAKGWPARRSSSSSRRRA